MYKVIVEFNEFKLDDVIPLKPWNGRELVKEGYVELIQESEVIEKVKRVRKPKES